MFFFFFCSMENQNLINIQGFTERINNLQQWPPTSELLRVLSGMGLEYINLLSYNVGVDHNLISVVIDSYDHVQRAFVFGNDIKLVYSLQDIFYLTGLPINGKAVAGVTKQPAIAFEEAFGVLVHWQPYGRLDAAFIPHAYGGQMQYAMSRTEDDSEDEDDEPAIVSEHLSPGHATTDLDMVELVTPDAELPDMVEPPMSCEEEIVCRLKSRAPASKRQKTGESSRAPPTPLAGPQTRSMRSHDSRLETRLALQESQLRVLEAKQKELATKYMQLQARRISEAKEHEEALSLAVSRYRSSEAFKKDVEDYTTAHMEELVTSWIATNAGTERIAAEGVLMYDVGQYTMQRNIYAVLHRLDNAFDPAAWGLPAKLENPDPTTPACNSTTNLPRYEDMFPELHHDPSPAAPPLDQIHIPESMADLKQAAEEERAET
nr:serine/threonine-protein phosphatase 7 long form homolog [Ipomoea batatas]